ncbi:MAG TPA: toll/interleukin-1 receptor domain-containing protein [Albitalea sp.]
MRIFISYSSRHRELCDRLRLALEADGRHEVFVDRSDLSPGKPFDETLRRGIAECDLFVFLVSPQSVSAGSYARAELSLAQARWRHPGGHVLPVIVEPTPMGDIPAYLRAVTLLEPAGDVVAETAAAVDALQRRGLSRWRLPLAAAGVLVLAAAGLGAFMWQRGRASEAQAALALTTAHELCESGNHALAWQRFDGALARHPDSAALRRAREDCAMRWLRDIRLSGGNFGEVVDRVLPSLAEGAALAGDGPRAADLRAHMGWAEFLRGRDGAAPVNPVAHYRKALTHDAGNVYAHAMWGHHVMATRGSIDEAREHFAAALAAGRERAFVRRFQLSAMLFHQEPPTGRAEALRIATEMRRAGETMDTSMRDRLWSNVYLEVFMNRQAPEALKLALRDAGAPNTFRWLYPDAQVRPDRKRLWRFLLASVEEAAGEKRAARARFDALREELQREGATGSMLDGTLAALERLGAGAPRAASAPRTAGVR